MNLKEVLMKIILKLTHNQSAMHFTKYLIPLLGILLLISCSGPVPASKITDISDIKAEIDLYQSLTDQADNIMSVALYDKKDKKIGSDSITIWVNRKKAEYIVIQQLYYTKSYQYRLENIPPENEQYQVEIQLANGKKFALGNIPALKLSDPSRITTTESTTSQDFSVRWSELHDVNKLYISKTFDKKDKENPNITIATPGKTDTLNIGKDGSYSIPKEKLLKSGEKLSIISLEFTAKKTGNTNPLLLKGSYIKINGSHDNPVYFK
ncbi:MULTISPECIES: hypothetical protein [Chryseobacterium]|uniref:hypothetical protein n=1 Tax=Chryseobacterium TaxID=59732 RepID=UPI0012973E8C|nr:MULTISPECIES: hypothetical protein [Chryseobacterium]MDR6921992.1 hypothetical protein [Chryseobacterium sp. 2987]